MKAQSQTYGIAALISAIVGGGGVTVALTYFEAELKKQPWVVELVTHTTEGEHKLAHLERQVSAMQPMLEVYEYLSKACLSGDKPRDECRLLGLEVSRRNTSVLLIPPSPVE